MTLLDLPPPSGLVRRAPPLSALEVGCGLPIGLDPPQETSSEGRNLSPRIAMERVLERALRKPPCLISFSGGRDSSALMALAVNVARREGLPLPIPVTLVFPGDAKADEDAWQQLVLNHLGISEWIRLPVEDELDAVGPVSITALQRHGLLWPPNAHFHLPIVAAAQGGSVVTGFGGDEIARSSESARAEQLLTRKRKMGRVDPLVVGLAIAPLPIRTQVHRRRAKKTLGALPWLTAAGKQASAAGFGRTEARIPLGWNRKLRRWIRYSRYFTVCQESFSVMGDSYDCQLVHPFVDPLVLDALASAGGFAGLGGRSQIMELLVGDVLPETILHRQSKGEFTDPLWTSTAYRFAASWSGDGLNEDLVDVEALRQGWLSDDRHILSTTLLQAARLHDLSARGA